MAYDPSRRTPTATTRRSRRSCSAEAGYKPSRASSSNLVIPADGPAGARSSSRSWRRSASRSTSRSTRTGPPRSSPRTWPSPCTGRPAAIRRCRPYRTLRPERPAQPQHAVRTVRLRGGRRQGPADAAGLARLREELQAATRAGPGEQGADLHLLLAQPLRQEQVALRSAEEPRPHRLDRRDDRATLTRPSTTADHSGRGQPMTTTRGLAPEPASGRAGRRGQDAARGRAASCVVLGPVDRDLRAGVPGRRRS